MKYIAIEIILENRPKIEMVFQGSLREAKERYVGNSISILDDKEIIVKCIDVKLKKKERK